MYSVDFFLWKREESLSWPRPRQEKEREKRHYFSLFVHILSVTINNHRMMNDEGKCQGMEEYVLLLVIAP